MYRQKTSADTSARRATRLRPPRSEPARSLPRLPRAIGNVGRLGRRVDPSDSPDVIQSITRDYRRTSQISNKVYDMCMRSSNTGHNIRPRMSTSFLDHGEDGSATQRQPRRDHVIAVVSCLPGRLDVDVSSGRAIALLSLHHRLVRPNLNLQRWHRTLPLGDRSESESSMRCRSSPGLRGATIALIVLVLALCLGKVAAEHDYPPGSAPAAESDVTEVEDGEWS